MKKQKKFWSLLFFALMFWLAGWMFSAFVNFPTVNLKNPEATEPPLEVRRPDLKSLNVDAPYYLKYEDGDLDAVIKHLQLFKDRGMVVIPDCALAEQIEFVENRPCWSGWYPLTLMINSTDWH